MRNPKIFASLYDFFNRVVRKAGFKQNPDFKRLYQFSEEKYQFLFNSGNDAIYLHELDGKFIEVNDVACRMLGYRREEFMKMTVKDIDAQDVTVAPGILNEFRQRGFVVMEMVHRGRDGRRIPVELSSRLLEIDGKKMVLTFARDITKRIEGQEELKQSHQQLEALYKEAQVKAARIAATNEIVRVISLSLDFKEMLKAFAYEIAKLINFDYMCISVIGDGDRLVTYPVFKNNQEIAVHEVFTLSTKLEHLKTVLETGNPLIINDTNFGRVLTDRSKSGQMGNQKSFAILPLNYKGITIGTFSLGSMERNVYGSGDFDLLVPLAGHLAVAIQNARLYEKVQELAVNLERNRIANEIHDSSIQVFGYFRSKGEFIEKLLEKGRIDDALTNAREIQEVAGEAYKEAREAIHALSDRIPAGQSLVSSVHDYLTKVSERWRIKAKCIAADNLPFLERKVELQLQRIIQEALANVRKHAKAKHVWVRFELKEGSFTVEIEDDGVGCDLDEIPENTFGFKAMKERAAGIGGRLIVQSKEGLGTRVVVRIPMG